MRLVHRALHGGSARRPAALWIALALAAALWLATSAAYHAPPSAPSDAPPAQFSGVRAKALLQRLLGDSQPHPMGSAANERLRERIVAQLRGLGLEPQLQRGPMVCSARFGACGTPVNILARLEGSEHAGDGGSAAVLLAAHYDSVPAGPGASDDTAGVATALEIARILTLRPRARHAVIVLLDDGEELGLLGAEAFVRQHPWAPQVEAAVNLEARGTTGPSLMFETGSANAALMRMYAQAVARPLANSVYYAGYQRMPNDTDFSVFKAAGYQGFNFAFIGAVAHYHTPLDDWQHADADSIGQQGTQALASLWALANAGSEPTGAAAAVYFDLFGRTLVRLPRAAVLPAAWLSLLGLLAIALRLIQRRRLTWRALLWAAARLLIALAAAAVCAGALLVLLRALGALTIDGAHDTLAHPLGPALCFTGLALGIAACIASPQRGSAEFQGLLLAAALLSALFAVALALLLPAASYVALLSALAALLLLWPECVRGAAGTFGAELAAIVLSAVSFTTVLPVVRPLYGALGSVAWPLATVLLVYAGFGVAALTALASARSRSLLRAVAATGMVAGLLAMLLLPRYSAYSPQRMNVIYELDADTQRSQWIVDSASGRLPASLRAVATFAGDTTPAPLRNRSAFLAPAPRLPLAWPQLTVRSAVPVPAAVVARESAAPPPRVHYQLRVASARSAPLLELLFPPAAAVDALWLQSENGPVRATPLRLGNGYSVLRLWNPADVQLQFEAAGEAFDLQLSDQSFGLPPAGRALQQARGAAAVPSQLGDVTVVRRSYRLQPP
jgi:hypothetical protein